MLMVSIIFFLISQKVIDVNGNNDNFFLIRFKVNKNWPQTFLSLFQPDRIILLDKYSFERF